MATEAPVDAENDLRALVGTVLAEKYRFDEVLGEGGMGAVWRAKQDEPFARQVALKLIKSGMDTRSVIDRFEAERKALTALNHPNIASVLDAGATEQGRPYFVMELVEGVPITHYCRGKKLDLASSG